MIFFFRYQSQIFFIVILCCVSYIPLPAFPHSYPYFFEHKIIFLVSLLAQFFYYYIVHHHISLIFCPHNTFYLDLAPPLPSLPSTESLFLSENSHFLFPEVLFFFFSFSLTLLPSFFSIIFFSFPANTYFVLKIPQFIQNENKLIKIKRKYCALFLFFINIILPSVFVLQRISSFDAENKI